MFFGKCGDKCLSVVYNPMIVGSCVDPVEPMRRLPNEIIREIWSYLDADASFQAGCSNSRLTCYHVEMRNEFQDKFQGLRRIERSRVIRALISSGNYGLCKRPSIVARWSNPTELRYIYESVFSKLIGEKNPVDAEKFIFSTQKFINVFNRHLVYYNQLVDAYLEKRDVESAAKLAPFWEKAMVTFAIERGFSPVTHADFYERLSKECFRLSLPMIPLTANT